MYRFIFPLLLIFLSIDLQAQIKSGPMVGYSAAREVGIWVQTVESATVKVEYWKQETPDKKHFSIEMVTLEDDHNIAQVSIDKLESGEVYDYNVWIDGKLQNVEYELSFQTQDIWLFRKAPADFSFVSGSCTYVSESYYDRPGEPYGGAYNIFSSILNENPDFMVWLGDNTYLREADYDSKSGIYARYEHTRALPEMQPLLGSVHHYAIWDDHDYGPNDSDWTYPLKHITRAAFDDFWMNPLFQVKDVNGVTNYFTWNDCDFYLLDNRWDRTIESDSGSIMGQKQLRWFLDRIEGSQASVHFVCIGGQVISDAKIFENYANFSEERAYLLSELDKRGVDNVVFLTGDRHHAELSKYVTDTGKVYYDITSSPLTSKGAPHDYEGNSFTIDRRIIGKRNYAHISVSGEMRKRVINLKYKDSDGKVIQEYELDFKE